MGWRAWLSGAVKGSVRDVQPNVLRRPHMAFGCDSAATPHPNFNTLEKYV